MSDSNAYQKFFKNINLLKGEKFSTRNNFIIKIFREIFCKFLILAFSCWIYPNITNVGYEFFGNLKK